MKKKIAKSAPKKAVKKTNVAKNDVALASSVAVAENKTGIIPLADRVLVRPFLETEMENKNSFGLIIPDTVSKERSEQGVVMAVGEGRREDGKLVPMRVRVGDTVLFSKYGFDEVKMGGQDLYILKEESILAILKK